MLPSLRAVSLLPSIILLLFPFGLGDIFILSAYWYSGSLFHPPVSLPVKQNLFIMSNKCHAGLLLFWSTSLAPFVSAFLSDLSLPRKLLTSRGRSTALFYFDDVSRDHTFGWTPEGGQGESDGTTIGTGAAKEKADAMQRRLFGHDLESASVLSDAQVEDETRHWIRDAGLVASEEARSATSIYGGGLLGLESHTSPTLVGCMASMWRSIVAFIDENADEYHPTDIWETDNVEHSQLFLQIFPRCEALYDYDTLKLMGSALEFCQNSCTHYGKRFKVVFFHPRYEHAPKMIYPEHHSPFPSMGLHVLGESEAAASNDDQEEDEIVRIGEPEEKAESITSSDIADFVPQLSEKKRSLERLFNSPAAVSSMTDSRSFGHTYQELSDEDIIAASKQWVEDQSAKTPLSLKYMDTAIDDTIKVSDATIAEQAYADIWDEISTLYDAGKIIDEEDGTLHGSVVSSLFIARTYSSYNASEFKRFAITVNAALKHLTEGKMFLELFHPEYVASRAGAQHSNRRSPYPMIQICYRTRT